MIVRGILGWNGLLMFFNNIASKNESDSQFLLCLLDVSPRCIYDFFSHCVVTFIAHSWMCAYGL